jgi:hypothetical protein
VWAEHIRAPLLVFPLVIGFGLGLLLAAVMRLAQIGHQPTLIAGAMLAAIIASAGQHYFQYRDFIDARAAILAQKSNQGFAGAFAEMMPTAPSFADYMLWQAREGRAITAKYSLRGAAAWASWALDSMLLIAAAVAMVYASSRSPYCSACRSWYRPVRTGQVKGETAARLADAAAVKIDWPSTTARYRLSHCASGCGPARLQLAFGDEDGHMQQAEAWLTAAGREEVTRVLDSVGVGWDERASTSEGPR